MQLLNRMYQDACVGRLAIDKILKKVKNETLKKQFVKQYDMYDKFADLLVEEFQIKRDEITMEAELAGDLGINSLELAELVLACEEKFNVVIDDEDLHHFTTVGDVVTYLENNQ